MIGDQRARALGRAQHVAVAHINLDMACRSIGFRKVPPNAVLGALDRCRQLIGDHLAAAAGRYALDPREKLANKQLDRAELDAGRAVENDRTAIVVVDHGLTLGSFDAIAAHHFHARLIAAFFAAARDGHARVGVKQGSRPRPRGVEAQRSEAERSPGATGDNEAHGENRANGAR